jgi:ATP-dependent protease ClpP protease subunit
MEKVYLYTSIDSYSAEIFARQLDAAKNGVEIRMLTNGGYTASGSAMLTSLVEYKGKKHVSVDGDVASMGAFFLLYADHIKMANTAEIMFHKAAFPKWYEEMAKESEKENLARENERFKAKMTERFGGSEAGKKLIETVFEEGKRNDVYLTAKDGKEIGLVDEIIEITPEQKAAFQKEFYKMALAEQKESTKENSNLKPNTTMEITSKDLETAKEAGIAEGIKQAEARIKSWLPYMEVDKEAAIAGIKSGEVISEEARSEFSIKLANKLALKSAQAENVGDLGTGAAKTADEIAKEAEDKRTAELAELEKQLMEV